MSLMSSSKSSDSEGCEWTWVTSDGQIEDEIIGWEQPQLQIRDVQDENRVNPDSLDSSESSDIERIEELPSKQQNDAIKHDEKSMRDNLLPAEEKQKESSLEPTRSFAHPHTTNERVNLSLNIVLTLVLALVLGLGLGHFVGWSGQWIRRNHGQQRQVDKLKLLQDELSLCLSDQTSLTMACDRKLNYWKRQFEELLFENEDLQRIMAHGRSSECNAKQNVEEEKEKLQLGLFYRQLEHAETLKQFELVQQDEQTHRRKLTALEEEKENLLLQLRAESKDDEKFLKFLIKENSELRLSMQSDERDDMDDMDDMDDDSIIRVEMGSLREQINQLQSENKDLRQVIARLRYGRPFDSMNEMNGLREKIEQMRTAIDEEKNATDTWKRMYERSKAEFNVTKATWQLLDAVQATTDEMLRFVEKNAARIVDAVQDAVNVTETQQRAERVVSGIANKFWDVVDDLNRRWDADKKGKKSSWSRKEKRKQTVARSDWVFDRARDREKQRRLPNVKKEKNGQENWYLRRKNGKPKPRRGGCATRDDDWSMRTPNVEIEYCR